MPKYPSDKRRYYDSDMSDPGRAMSRGRSRNVDRREGSDRGRSSSHRQGGAPGGSGSSYPPRRPGEPSSGQHGSSSTPYARPPQGPSGGAHPSSARGEHISSREPRPSSSQGGAYPSSARGEHMRSVGEHRPQSAYSETGSETASVTGSTGGGESASLGRGALRGRRVLPSDIITRPRELETKQGGFGQPIQLQANYFKLLTTTDWCLYQYAVDFSPEEDRNVVRKGLLRPHREALGAYIFDGSNLYTSNQLPCTKTEALQLSSERQGDNQQMIISIRLTGDMTRGDHHYIQFFNIIMRKCLDYLHLQLVGRNYFDAANRVEVRDYRLELWPGYITSIRQHERDILLCAEVTHKVMRNETLLDVLGQCYTENRADYQNLFSRAVIGVVVLTDYNNNTYRIDDVDYEVTPSSTFKKRDGTPISYQDYYFTKYQIRIQDQGQPLLVSRSRSRDRRGGKDELVYLVPELCRSTGLTDQMRGNFKLMSALAQHTRVSPADRIRKLMNFNQRLQTTSNVVEELRSWNMTLDRNLVNIPARVLPADKIVYANQVVSEVPYNANWTGDVRNKTLLKCAHLEEWALLVPNRFRRDCQAFVAALTRVASSMNFRIDPPTVYDMRDDNPSTYADMLDQVKSRQNPMLIFCVASNNRVDRYSAIKKKCCVERPVPTQVVLSKNLAGKSQMSIATKVAIQMNCKIGGIPWSVSIPLSGLMVVGFDVCHDTMSKDKDFGAMVASLDMNFGRYFSAVSSHTSGEELSSDLSVNLCKAIDQFRHYNNALPKRIVLYRDGVGDGQIDYVYNHEVKQVLSKLETVYGDPDSVKLAYIIVTKKINTRLFYKGRENPPPGTVVDDVITHPNKYDFLIISQHVTQGTVSPTAYNVIWDKSGLDVDKLQRLTYKLCHMYFNWSGTVRVPAPCQYAHKLAFLVAQAVHQSPHHILETLLYFL